MEIYTTGAYLYSAEVIVNGVRRWHWLVGGFEEDTFNNGEVFNPPESAHTRTFLETPKESGD